MFYLIVTALFLVSAVICFYIAKSRNANTRFWIVMGIVFGPFAIPFAYFSRSNAPQK